MEFVLEVLDGQWKNLVECNGLQAGLHTVHEFAFGYGDRHVCFVIDTHSGCGSDYGWLMMRYCTPAKWLHLDLPNI
ncbi:hypothetical protein MRB53_034842 [Persea americana]|uniref:Uncharacterized protein n=1 Tax=Persea americana TaxID=3435 RepID=A0ACC2K306_PERAE|nr:hypothetical protein MRB53_034842 [Persea americana]